MNNFISDGKRLEWYNDSGSPVISGQVVLAGSLVGVAVEDIASTGTGALALQGVFALPKGVLSTCALTVGQAVYWDASGAVVTGTIASGVYPTATANVFVGKVTKAATAAATTVQVRLCN